MKGASSAQVLRHGVFAVAVGVVGTAASVVLCLVVGWAYDLVCAHGWLLYLLPIFAVASLLLYRALKLPLDTTTQGSRRPQNIRCAFQSRPVRRQSPPRRSVFLQLQVS